MPLPAWIGGIFKPVADLVDNLHTSGEEKGQMQIAMIAAQADLADKMLTHDAKIVEAKASIIRAEASAGNKLTSMWRPLIMLMFGAIILNNHIVAPYLGAMFGDGASVSLPVPDELWALLKLGLGGYIIGRSGEKIAKLAMRKG